MIESKPVLFDKDSSCTLAEYIRLAPECAIQAYT